MQLVTTDIAEKEEAFIRERDAAFVSLANVSKAAIAYGDTVMQLREECGSDKALQTRLIELGARLSFGETQKLMKVAARAKREGSALFTERQGLTWAQSEMGLLPPAPRGENSKAEQDGERLMAGLERIVERMASLTLTDAGRDKLGAIVERLSDFLNSQK